MGTVNHPDLTDETDIHVSKGFTEASNETALVKNTSGQTEWRALSQLGDTGPTGPAGSITDEQQRAIFNGLATGILKGGTLTIDADTTKFDLSAGSGWIINNVADPENPVGNFITWTDFDAQTVTNLATADVSHIAINISGAIVQQTAIFTQAQLRTLINIGFLSHPNRTNISSAIGIPNVACDADLTTNDFINTIGPVLNRAGNIYSPNGANLNINRSAGETFRVGINFVNSKQNPNIFTDASESPVADLFYRLQDGSGGFKADVARTAINGNSFDNGSGTLAAVAVNKFTIQRIFFESSTAADTLIQYGQIEYNSLSDAEAALTSDPFVVDPILNQDTAFRAFLIVKQGITDLSISADARFLEVSNINPTAATSVSVDLQASYNASTSPEITTDGTQGALTIKEGASVGGSLLECKDDADVSVLDVTITEIKADKQAYSPTETLTDASTIASNMENGNVKTVTLTANRTLGAPTNLKDGATYIWIIKQDATGSRTLAYNSVFKFEGGIAPVLSVAANAVDILTGISDGTNVFTQLIKDFS